MTVKYEIIFWDLPPKNKWFIKERNRCSSSFHSRNVDIWNGLGLYLGVRWGGSRHETRPSVCLLVPIEPGYLAQRKQPDFSFLNFLWTHSRKLAHGFLKSVCNCQPCSHVRHKNPDVFQGSGWSLLYVFFLPTPCPLLCLTRLGLSGVPGFPFLPAEQTLLLGHHSLSFTSFLWPQLPLMVLAQVLTISLDPI